MTMQRKRHHGLPRFDAFAAWAWLAAAALCAPPVAAGMDGADAAHVADGSRACVQEDDEPTVREQIRAHVRTVKSTSGDLNDKLDALEELLLLGPEGCDRAAQELNRILKKERASFAKDRDRLMDAMAKAASKTIDARLNRKALAEIEEIRQTLRSYSTSANLTKQEVHEHCDPAIAALRGFLRVDESTLVEALPELGESAGTLRDRADDAALMVDYFSRAKAALLDGDAKTRRRADRLQVAWDTVDLQQGLESELRHRLWLAAPMADADRRVLDKNVELRSQVEPSEAEGNRLLNDIRLIAGLNACLTDPKLCAAGRDHSKDMKEKGFFSHQSPVDGKRSFGDRAANFGASAHAENIAHGQRTPKAAIDAWWYSPGHHRNMMGGGHARVGLGRHANHWTQLFGG